MSGKFLTPQSKLFLEGNIYANKSSMVLSWLLLIGIEREGFSVREVSRETGVSVGLVQKVINALVYKGYIQIEGIRTAKRFFLKKPKELLRSWIENYSIVKKCKMWTYRSGLADRKAILKVLQTSNLRSKTVLALHSAAEAHKCKHTNLETLEIYITDPKIRKNLEELLGLEPQERGYEVLIIEPYYKSLLSAESIQKLKVSPVLLTFLDLYHFPLRGLEQAEFMADRIVELKRIYAKG